jgi:NAD(P)-dependent dehydrogenase (short-subunit alcohol dehydrogenase family)
VHKQSVDVTSDSAVAALAKEVEAKEGRLDVLVNNAGYSAAWVPIHESNPSDWWRTFEVNLKGPYLLAQAFLPLLLKTAEKTGHVDIINMASMGAHQVNAVASSYTISKLALCRFTENIDVTYADKGINVISVNPGGVETAMSSKEIHFLKPCKWLC